MNTYPENIKRKADRALNQLREITITPNYNKYAEGSCLIEFGNTKIICTASLEAKVPRFLKGTGKGWLTAEYGMLPRSTAERMEREAVKGKQSGRTQEIQRLIGRSLRTAVDFEALGERQIKIDCDVLQADGGTRTASICGGYIALYLAFQTLVNKGIISHIPLTSEIAAISCGVYNDQLLLDLDYSEDSQAQTDANFVMTADKNLIEVQVSSEKSPINKENFQELFFLAEQGIEQLIIIQRAVLQNYLQANKEKQNN
ncbi:Ribonuclease PH [Candidatus Hepatincolaceae symbiont of Richtersius coronifer]